MRGKRSKQYRKLMQQYGLAFGFREPYQVLVDAGILEDAVARFKMDFVGMLGRTLHGQVKPMVTQCTIRHLYNLSAGNTDQQDAQGSEKVPLSQADKTAILSVARTCEKRRCGHHELDEPLSTLECFKSVIDPKASSTNKHRYAIACQDEATRSWARGVRGVPSIYVKRSVMILEPMAEVSTEVKDSAERDKLRSGLKRKRNEPRDEARTHVSGTADRSELRADSENAAKILKKTKGPKGPNPLSMKKPKARSETNETQSNSIMNGEANVKKKRKRRHGGGDLLGTEIAITQGAQDY